MHVKTRRPPDSQAATQSGRSTSPCRSSSDLPTRTAGLPAVGKMSALPMIAVVQMSVGLHQAVARFLQLSLYHAATAGQLHSRRLIEKTHGRLIDETVPLRNSWSGGC